jgi:hypothetical protein
MASTYSPNLGLDLPATGDGAGSWGTTTNTNLGTLIEQAISGYVTQAVTDGADTTITIPNGATGVARNMYIELTGALSNPRNVIVPANKKLYFIYNNTTGGFDVTVKVAGQTGVAVPATKRTCLVCSGTDVFEALNYMSTTTTFTGAASATDNAIARYDGTTGKVIQNSSVTVSDSGLVTATSFAGIGTSLTALSATNVNSGTLAAARLPSNTALYDAVATFTNSLMYGPAGVTASEVGFRDIPRVAATSSGFVITSAHRGRYIDSMGYANVVMGANSSYPMALGSAIAVYNNSASNMTITSTDTLRRPGTGSSGTVTLSQRGWATFIKIHTIEWIVMGPGAT